MTADPCTWAEGVLGEDSETWPKLGEEHSAMLLAAFGGRLTYTQVQVVKAVLKLRTEQAAFRATHDEGGLPIHLPMAVDEEENGPVSDKDSHHWMCWCPDPKCMWTVALSGTAWEADLRKRLERAADRLKDRVDDPVTRGAEKTRLTGKLEGVKLALSYVREIPKPD